MFSRYWHTLRYLQPGQVYGRVLFKLRRPRPKLGLAPPLSVVTGQWSLPARREPSLFDGEVFEFLGVQGGLSEIGWVGPQREKLWRYNQHYFDDLNALGADLRFACHVDLMQQWVDQNQPAEGEGWEPYPTSLRIVNWIKWSLAGNLLPDYCNQSLAIQARWLMQRLETHLLGNHLFANAKALVFAGLYFNGPEADIWRDKGLKILTREVPEQILVDGGHFERSTMYHALAFEDVLDLCNISECYSERLASVGLEQLTEWHKRIPEMWHWLHAMCHPDGAISFFNDAAFGVAPSLQELDAYAERLGFERDSIDSRTSVVTLTESGYLRLQSADAILLLDVAPIGPDYLPGHAHADTLSFELSIANQRVFVNSGTSCYGGGVERLRQRGTAAHNTVVVNSVDSSEVWGGFRVARRARPIELSVDAQEDCVRVVCAHDGYTRLQGRPIHERRWTLEVSALVVEDRVIGAYQKADARFHIHPEVHLVLDKEACSGRMHLPSGQVLSWAVDCGVVKLEESTYHPRFGHSIPNQCLVISLEGNQPSKLHLAWTTA